MPVREIVVQSAERGRRPMPSAPIRGIGSQTSASIAGAARPLLTLQSILADRAYLTGASNTLSADNFLFSVNICASRTAGFRMYRELSLNNN